MNNKHNRIVFALLLSIMMALAAHNARAAGFYIAEVGTPTSLGTAGVANPTNVRHADAAWTNPAGMTGLDRDSMLAGMQLVVPKMEFDSSVAEAGGGDGGNAGQIAVVPSFFYVNKLSDRARLGLSLTAPQGGGVDYGNHFVGRYQTSMATLAGIAISPSIAYKINDRFSIGAGVSFIYTKFEQDIMINQGAVVDGAGDAKVKIEDATDWGYQPFLGMTYQVTERALLGLVYRAEADVDLEGDVKFHNLVIQNPGTHDVDLSWDNPQWLEAGLRYRLSSENYLYLSAGWQDWSEFGEKNEVSLEGHVTTLDRKWEDTWHAGVAFSHQSGRGHGYSVGLAYESSPVEDKYRTYDLPVDEIYKLSASYFWEGNKQLDFSLGSTLYLVGDADIDVTSQGVRSAGKFDQNYILFLGGTARYRF